MITSDDERAVDEEIAIQLSATIAERVLQVIGQFQQLEQFGPRFLQYISLHAVGAVLNTMMRDVLHNEADPERARVFCAKMVAEFETLVRPAGPRPFVH